MSEFKFSCPACGRDILADTSYAGKDIACPICKAVIVVPKGDSGATPLQVTSPSTPLDQDASATRRTSGLAIASLVCSLSSLVTCIGWLPGIICGHLAKSQIRRNPSLKGLGLAKAGLIIGYLILISEAGSTAYYTWRISTAVKHGYENARQSLVTNNFFVIQTNSTGFSNQTRPMEPAQNEVRVTNNQQPEPVKTATIITPPPPIESSNPAWTSDINRVSFPAHPVSGKLQGLDFALTTTWFRNGDLRLRSANDMRLDVYHLGTSIEGRSYLVQPADDSKDNPHVKMTWHEGDAIMTATFNKGYGLKLEFTQATDRKVSGKIYLCFPDDSKSRVAGTFEVRLPRNEARHRRSTN